MNIDALVSAPVGYTVNVAAALAWLARCYENSERWFIRDEAGNILAGPLDEMPTLDECALVGGGPGRRAHRGACQALPLVRLRHHPLRLRKPGRVRGD